MKIQPIMSILAASLLVLAGTALVGCQMVSGGGSSGDKSGTAHYFFPVHQSAILADASVTTNADGLVTGASIQEWMDPASWVFSTGANGALVGGEMIRLKMAGKNATSVFPNAVGYTFFYYNLTGKGWVEFTPAAAGTVPTTATTGQPTFDLRMAGLAYATAYAAASANVTADPTNTDLTTVHYSLAAFTGGTDFTIDAANAATQVKWRASKVNTDTTKGGALCKNDPASVYFPMNTAVAPALGNLGYRANLAALIAFFKTNPNANYNTAVQKAETLPAATTDYTFVAASANLPSRTVTNAWVIPGSVDSITGATYSDFPNYANGLQNAYMFALSVNQTGISRAVKN